MFSGFNTALKAAWLTRKKLTQLQCASDRKDLQMLLHMQHPSVKNDRGWPHTITISDPITLTLRLL